ncbi:glycosyltransferase family protein [Sandaracinus amylolyticus]|uniref:Glycosyltransferase n=1 Tax=Sandaracinus amylolyticus TaxID=927083 RepID=A0A0F6W660_9BACT|nr:glycosyltransferase family protein [Sandaracinus amylolyticus]AKF08417.1 Glycosyltransferase [Sandaracinus amylolyticus]
MRILYGVVGEGMGHAMRSRVVLEHLLSQGHEVEIMASGRAVDFLQKRFTGTEVNRIHGLHIVYEENRVRRGKTLFENVFKGTAALPKQIAAYFELIGDFAPQCVISDFESWTYFYGKAHRLPVISIDNMQVLNRCWIDDEAIEGHRADFEIAKAFVKSKLPFCDWYLITTFFHPPIRKERTSLHKPILRPEILSAKRSRGDHLLVYQTAEGYEGLVETLQKTGLECRVYGMRRNIAAEQVEGNLRYRPFSETGFIDDLASARAVIAGGGFTLMGEAVFLHKPMLSVPVGGQYEQVLNGRYLQKLGYGRYAESLDDPKVVHDFVASIERCEEALATYDQKDNAPLMRELDQLLDRAAAGL